MYIGVYQIIMSSTFSEILDHNNCEFLTACIQRIFVMTVLMTAPSRTHIAELLTTVAIRTIPGRHSSNLHVLNASLCRRAKLPHKHTLEPLVSQYKKTNRMVEESKILVWRKPNLHTQYAITQNHKCCYANDPFFSG